MKTSYNKRLPARLFVTAISTDSGKSLVSAILTEALQADYWKPIQAGKPTDTDLVKSLVSNSKSRFHPEHIVLENGMSPHAAAEIEGLKIAVANIKCPQTENLMIVEGAGGILVPLNDTEFVIDIAEKFGWETVLVCNLYLGSINHSLLTLNEMKRRNIRILGIVFNGQSNPQSEQIILKHSDCPCLFRIPQLASVDKNTVSLLAKEAKKSLAAAGIANIAANVC